MDLGNAIDTTVSDGQSVDKSVSDSIDATVSQKESSARQNMLGAIATTPDKATNARQLSAVTGAPSSVILNDPAPAQRAAALKAADAAFATSPVLHDHVANDPQFTNQASDDLGLLAQLGNSLSRGWRTLKETIPAAQLGVGASALSEFNRIDSGEKPSRLSPIGELYLNASPEQRSTFRTAYLPVTPQVMAGEATDIARLEAEKRTFPTPSSVDAIHRAPTILEALKGIGRHPLDYMASAIPEGAIGAAPGMVAAVPASIAGPGGSALAFGGVNALQTMGPAILDELGRLGVDTANPEALTQALRDPAIAGPVIDAASKRAGIAGIIGALSGGLAAKFPGLKIQAPTQAALGVAQPLAAGAATGEPASPSELIGGALSGVAASPFEVAATVLSRMSHVVTKAAEPVIERNAQATQAVADAQTLKNVSDQAASSQLRPRDPEAFKAYVERATDESGGTAPSHLYVSNADILQALKTATPEQLKELPPTLAAQVHLADLTGADLQIPLSDFVTHLAGTDIGEALLPHVRTAPEAMTGAEAQARDPHAELIDNIAQMAPHEMAQALNPEAVQPALDALDARTNRNIRMLSNAKAAALKELQADAQVKRDAIRAEVSPEVQREPVYAVQRFLQRGELTPADHTNAQRKIAEQAGMTGTKFNTEALRQVFGDSENAIWRYLPTKYLTKEGGMHPDAVSQLFGFESSDKMVKDILGTIPEHQAIEAATDQRMLERHGELSDPKALERAAEASVAHDHRANQLAAELSALNRAMGSARDIARKAKAYATMRTAQARVRDLSPGQFEVAERRAAKAVATALASGDTRAAAVAKREQLLSNHLTRATIEAHDDVQQGLKYLRKFDSPTVRKNIDVEYRDQIDSLLNRFDLRTSVTNKALDKRESLSAFVERMAAMGYQPSVPEHLLDEASRTHYRNMAVGQFRGLIDGVKSIEALGRLKNTLLDVREQRDLDVVAAEAAGTMHNLPTQVGPESNRGLSRIEKKWANVKSAGRSMGASILKIEQMMDWLDGRNPQGTFNRVVFRRISEASGRENDMQKAMAERLNALSHALPDDALKGNHLYVADSLIDSKTGQPSRFTKKELLALAGNVGNESNLQKVLRGEGWSEPALWDFLHKNMTKGDWDFVQGLGNAFESLWPEQLAMSRRLGNTNPDQVQPRPFDTAHGEYAGWYWPLIYDPARSQDVAERGARQGDAMFENIYSRANTDTGRMNSRVEEYARPLLFDLDAVPRVIRDVIHDISYREAVMDSDKFLSHPMVREGIVHTLGPEYQSQLRPWLQSIANDKAVDGAALKFWQGLSRRVRMNATMAGLGFRLTTMLVHGSSAGLESIAELGPKWFASGLSDFRNPTQWAKNKDFVFERSAEMRNRMNEVDRDIREHLREIDLRMSDPTTGAVQRGLDIARGNAYMGIAMLDMATALPTWMGAYKKALSEGSSEADAVYFGDKTVRNAHGGTGAKDLSAVQRGNNNEFFKLFTMFYSFWNHNANRLMDTARLAKELPASKNFHGDLGRVVMRTLIYTLGVQVIHSMLHPTKPGDEDQSWGTWAAKELALSATSGIPVVRDIAAHWIEGGDYAVTPAAAAVRTISQSGTDAMHALNGEETSGKWLKHAANTTGYVFGVPTGQLGDSAQFLWDVGQGYQDPHSFKDWWNGVLHGDMDSQ